MIKKIIFISVIISIAVCSSITLQATSDHNLKTEFSDIKGHWGETYIKKAISAGLIKGNSDGNFDPDGYFTIEDAMVMAVKINNLTIRPNKPWELEGIPYAEAAEKLHVIFPSNALVYNTEEWNNQLKNIKKEDITKGDNDEQYRFELAGLINVGISDAAYEQITLKNNMESLEYFSANKAVDIRDGGLKSKISKGFMVEILTSSILYRDDKLTEKKDRLEEYQKQMISIVEKETGRSEEEFTEEDKKTVDLGMIAGWPQAVYCIEKDYIMRQNTYESLLRNVTRAEACTIMIRFLGI